MRERLDEKGKIFTERVRKQPVEATIITTQGTVHGYLYVAPGQRVKDMLNNPDEQFVAVTGVRSRKNGETSSSEMPFMALNKQFIISVIPINEPKADSGFSA
jgi:hypothetical protein